jgi:hypothetical protein
VEVPLLGISSVRCLDDHVSVVDEIKISVVWQLRNDVEWSFNVKSELLVELSFLWFSLPFVNIHDIPLLMDSIVLFVNTNVSVLSINIANNFDSLALFVYNSSALVSE